MFALNSNDKNINENNFSAVPFKTFSTQGKKFQARKKKPVTECAVCLEEPTVATSFIFIV
eukprot:Awhi_evm1s1623